MLPPRRAHSYAEQLSGTAFTVPRAANLRTWLYRIRPSVTHTPFGEPVAAPRLAADGAALETTPDQLRWSPLPLPAASESVDFVAGLQTYAAAGEPSMKAGMAVHYYAANASMLHSSFYSADGDMLLVPQEGALDIRTELGLMRVRVGEIAVLPRGHVFAVRLVDGAPVRGYVAEVYSGHFRLPDLGPIGANGLANARDFKTPVAAYERVDGVRHTRRAKFLGRLFETALDHSPFDVVAWHGNYVSYKYDLADFCAINSVSFDHMDPSIFTVLTVPTTEPGVAACDFVVFPPRWMVAEATFRPPYYHRNLMSEFMGLIRGEYDAKKGGEDGFRPGGASLHSCMSPHGPDAATFEAASVGEQRPVRMSDGDLAFMFESTYIFRVSRQALESPTRQKNYYRCWADLQSHFDESQ